MLANKALSAAPSAVPVYVEDVFSSYLYTGNSSTQTINNGIDLAGKGGLVWIKRRNAADDSNLLDTARGTNSVLSTEYNNAAQTGSSWGISNFAFNSNGASWSGSGSSNNNSSGTYVSWTFAEQEKFFDVVTYTGTGSTRTVSHNLGSVPGCIIVKRTDGTGGWYVYHRANTANPETDYLLLNSTAATVDDNTIWNDTAPTASVFTVADGTEVNFNGHSYVAYLFAHNAGGFGLTGADNVISCGSFTTDGSGNATVDLGWEPQFIIRKGSTIASNWEMYDNMRGIVAASSSQTAARLSANLSDAEGSSPQISINSTGFAITSGATSQTFIYIAIRRGPMKTPTSGTSVFYPKVHAGSSSYDVGFPTDLCISGDQSGNALNSVVVYRLAGNNKYFGGTASTAAEQTVSVCQFDLQNSFQLSYNNNNQARWHFKRAPGFFDVVCYTGTGSNRTVTHNLGVTPELMIVKCRSAANDWAVYANNDNTDYLLLNSTAATADDNTYWNDTTPTASVFSVGTNADVNTNNATYVAYLFASVTGVSKVGSYTGTGSTQTINCGFTAGSRFVMVKRTDSTGDWYVWDSARGIVSGNDPYLLLNSTAAEVTNTDYIDTANSGFEISSTAPAAINANGGTFVFLAIA
jgi:hypothetical protein